jgi:hypothetical protein
VLRHVGGRDAGHDRLLTATRRPVHYASPARDIVSRRGGDCLLLGPLSNLLGVIIHHFGHGLVHINTQLAGNI